MWLAVKLYMSKVWVFVRPFVNLFLSSIGPALAQAATAAVAAVAEGALTDNNQKRDAAFEQIVDTLKHQGITLGADVTTSMINLAIETAVAATKDK